MSTSTNALLNLGWILHCVWLVSTVVPVFQDPEDNQYERADEVDLRNSTTLLDLDSYLYNVMVDPTKGTGKELLDKFELITHCMRKARTMFVYGNEEADYGIRAATLIFFNSGGPTFNRIPLYNEENTAPIKREFDWTDEDIKKLEQRQLEAEAAWNKLRRSIL
jgi:hypothetical protein